MISWEILIHLLRLLSDWLLLILLLRFYLNRLHMPLRYPLMQFCVTLTHFIVSPIANLFKTKRINPVLVAIVCVALCTNWIILIINPLLSYNFSAPATWIGIIGLAGIDVIRQSFTLLTLLIIAHVLLSLLRPIDELTVTIHKIIAHFLKPFQWLKIANIQLGYLIAVLLIQLIGMPLIGWLELQCAAFLQLII